MGWFPRGSTIYNSAAVLCCPKYTLSCSHETLISAVSLRMYPPGSRTQVW